MARHESYCARPSARSWRLAAIFAAAFGLLPTGLATAQKYDTVAPTLTIAQWKALQPKITATLRQPSAPTPAQLAEMDEGFLKYYFPTMTMVTPENLGALAKARNDLLVQYINQSKAHPAARDHLIGLAMKAMGPISARNFHPAVRYNATLILGQLDQKMGTTGASATPPTPLPAGTNALTMLVELDDIKGVAVPASVKIAALVGLERHTRFGVDPQLADRITAAALKYAGRTEPPEEIAADVNDWMRRLAAQVLANQFSKGFTQPVHQAFVSIVGGKELNLDDRCNVAEMLKPSMYEGAQGVKASEMADALGVLANAVLDDERNKAEEFQEEMVNSNPGFGGRGDGGGGGFGRGRGGFGRGRGDGGGGGFASPLEDKGPHFERRRTLDRLMAVLAAADSLAAGSGDLKQRMTELSTPIKQAADKIVNTKTGEVEVADTVVELAETVAAIVSGARAPAGGDADAAEAPAEAGAAADAGAADAGQAF